VLDARVHERLLDAIAVDRYRGGVGVLLDDREQVAEQPPLGRGQLGPLDRRVVGRMEDSIDRWPRGRDPAAPGRSQAVAGFALLRNLRPSSYR
jgi:hypothetical protein